MIFGILKRDLKRKKSMNIILLLFVILAAMFVASGLNNVISVMQGTDYYLDKAGIEDYTIITVGDESVGHIDEVLKDEECVSGYRIESVVYGARDNILLDNGDKAVAKNTSICQAIEDAKISYFDINNDVIGKIDEGHVYVTSTFLEKNELKAGDRVRIKFDDTELSLVVDGKAKDALLGSNFMGNQRFLLNKSDYQKLLDNESVYEHSRGEIAYIRTDDIKKMSSVAADIQGVSFSGAIGTIKMCYVMDMVVAFLILILSICLIIVSFVVLRFSINFTIIEEFREIGVMKAIGITNGKIRSLYIVKYLVLAVAGAGIGFIASIPFGNMLLKSVSENMVISNDIGILTNVAGSAAVIVLILMFAYYCTGKVKKSSPIDAIRSGQTGERYKSKSVYRIGKSHVGTNMYLAVNDVLSTPRRFITIIISFFICTLFVLMIVNTTATIESPNLVHTFGSRSDLYMTDDKFVNDFLANGSRENISDALKERADELTDNGMPASVCVEVQYKYKVSAKGSDYMISCQQGVGTKADDYVYTEGTVPQNAEEIAITPQIADEMGIGIGDTVTIDYGTGKKDCMVTAYFQTMNQLGEIIRLHQDMPDNYTCIASVLQLQINFTDNPDDKLIDERKERIKELYNNDDVKNATEYCVDCIGVVDTMKAVQFLLLAITLIVVLLVTILMERSFIADEKNQIAILKAVGFADRDIIRWHIWRFGAAALVAVILAAVASIPMTKLCISPIFGMMGATDVDFNIEPLRVFLLYPGIVLLATVLVAWITSLYTKTITCRDTANIE